MQNVHLIFISLLVLSACDASNSNQKQATKAIKLTQAQQLGETVWVENCKLCHQPGLAHAPKIGDVAEWDKREKKGFDTLVKHAIEGFNEMPARGAKPNLSDHQVRDAVDYMVAMSQ